jgi:hypothetical protein
VRNKYSGFKLLNLKTKQEIVYPYVKGKNNRDVEDQAIKEQMELTGLSRSNFMVNGLVE